MREITIEDRAAMDILWNASRYVIDNIHNYEDFMFLRAIYLEIKRGCPLEHPVFDYRQWLKDSPYVPT